VFHVYLPRHVGLRGRMWGTEVDQKSGRVTSADSCNHSHRVFLEHIRARSSASTSINSFGLYYESEMRSPVRISIFCAAMTTLFFGAARRNVPVVYRILTCDRQLLHYSSTTITVDHFGNHNPGITRDSRTAFASFSRFVP
jgi:hypothetical protein